MIVQAHRSGLDLLIVGFKTIWMDVIALDNILLDYKTQNKVWSGMRVSKMTECKFFYFLVNCLFKSPYSLAAVQYVQTSCLKSRHRGVFLEACTLYFLIYELSLQGSSCISQTMNRI